MDAGCTPISRALYPWEIQEAFLVFAEQIDYARLRIHECNSFPNHVHRLGCWLKRIPYTGTPNAITLGNHCYFPIRLAQNVLPPEHAEFYKLAWLIHELTHAWQYQRLGWRYLALALYAQFRNKENVYDFGGEKGLQEISEKGGGLSSLNMEQQGELARTYYLRLKNGSNVSAWLPFIEEIQKGR